MYSTISKLLAKFATGIRCNASCTVRNSRKKLIEVCIKLLLGTCRAESVSHRLTEQLEQMQSILINLISIQNLFL